MKRLVSIAAAAALSTLAIAGVANASTMSDTSAIQSLKNGQFSLVRIDSLDHDAAYTVKNMASVDANSVQQAIRSNPTLLRDLKQQNVQVDNVVAAAQNMDGSVRLYLR